ncbi:MAG: NUDIX hydrolase [Limisphaerales bacterium]
MSSLEKQTQPRWLNWAMRLQAVAQNGLTYAANDYDTERYNAIRQIAAEMLAAGSGAEVSAVSGLLSHETGYATPKVDVRGVVFREEKLLLVRERAEGRWSLPGGWADVGESPAECIVREIREESGLEARAVKLLAALDRSKHPHDPPFAFHVYKLFFLCHILGGEPKASPETDAVGFFGEAEIPTLSTTRVTPRQIQRCFEHFRNPSLAADFD